MKTIFVKLLFASLLLFVMACPPEEVYFGCTDSIACNYDASAQYENGTCIYESDCLGECGGSAVIDDCGICDGGNADIDCNGDCLGNAIIDDCGVCSEGTSGHTANRDMVCAGVWFGDAFIDDCDECVSGGTNSDNCLSINESIIPDNFSINIFQEELNRKTDQD